MASWAQAVLDAEERLRRLPTAQLDALLAKVRRTNPRDVALEVADGDDALLLAVALTGLREEQRRFAAVEA